MLTHVSFLELPLNFDQGFIQDAQLQLEYFGFERLFQAEVLHSNI